MANNQTEIRYPIPGNETGGRLILFGDAAASHILFFCGGYPDSCQAFQPLADRIATEQNNVLCGVTCLPGFDFEDDKTSFKMDGYSLEEMASSLREATKALLAYSKNPKATLTGVFHDWACMIGTMCANRMNQDQDGVFSKLVYFDILMPVDPSHQVEKEQNLKKELSVLPYRIALAICFLLQRYVSFFVAAGLFSVSFTVLRLIGLNPVGQLDWQTWQGRESRPSMRKLLYMAYPYWKLLCAIAQGIKLERMDLFLPKDVAKTPVLFLYGTEKPLSFHDDNDLAWLMKQPSCKTMAVKDAGHWLYIQQPDTCFQAMKEFVLGK